MTTVAILCDIGNVAVFFNNRRSDAALAALSGMSQDAVTNVVFRKGQALIRRYERGDISSEEFRRMVCARLNITKREMPSDEAFFEAWADVFTPNQPLIDKLCQLRAYGYVTAAVSNIDEMRYRKIDQMRLLNCFDELLLSYQEGIRKPSSELMVRALDRCGADAAQTIFVDDLEENLVPAAGLGIATHLYTDMASFSNFLASRGM
jgi:putative hydrolase of the HAD superfamily